MGESCWRLLRAREREASARFSGGPKERRLRLRLRRGIAMVRTVAFRGDFSRGRATRLPVESGTKMSGNLDIIGEGHRSDESWLGVVTSEERGRSFRRAN